MNLEDESLLSAFLDDELDDAHRPEVEAAVRSDARLAQRLRALAETRDLVAGLRRPAAPADLSGAILARLARRPSAPSRLLARARRLPGPFLLGAGASLAAGVVIVASMALPAREPRLKPAAPRAPAGGNLLAKAMPPARPSKPEGAPDWRFGDGSALHDGAGYLGNRRGDGTDIERKRAGDDAARPPASGPMALGMKRDGLPEAPKVEAHLGEAGEAIRGRDALAFAVADADPARAELAALLVKPGARRLMVVADVIDARTIEAFDGVVRDARLKHPRQGRIALGQGVILDPDDPDGRAVIFAMAMDDAERDGLRKALAKKFPSATIEEDLAPPDVSTNLALEVGKFEVFEGEAAAGLLAYQSNHLNQRMMPFKAESNTATDAPAPAPSGAAAAPEPSLEAAKPEQARGPGAARDLARPETDPAAVALAPSAGRVGELAAGGDKARKNDRRAAMGRLDGGLPSSDRPAAVANKPGGPAPPALFTKDRAEVAKAKEPAAEPETVFVWLAARPPG